MCVCIYIYNICIHVCSVDPSRCWACTPVHTDGLALAQEKVRKEFSKKTGQALLIRHKAWTDECTKQQTVYM